MKMNLLNERMGNNTFFGQKVQVFYSYYRPYPLRLSSKNDASDKNSEKNSSIRKKF